MRAALPKTILPFDPRRGEVGLETGNARAMWTIALLLAVNVPLWAQMADWSAYGADKANTKYSALAQIDRANVARLHIAWRWKSADFRIEATHPNLRTWLFETTPDSVLAKRSTRSGAVCRSVGSVVWLNRSTVERRIQGPLAGEWLKTESGGAIARIGHTSNKTSWGESGQRYERFSSWRFISR